MMHVINSLKTFLIILLGTLLMASCQSPKDKSLVDIFHEMEGLTSNQEYINSPFLTAGNRLYMVGHQNGSFPDLGWHVKGEMGGIWNHPIKLMDGFMVSITKDQQTVCLDNADEFINYPVGNQLIYRNTLPGIEVRRVHFVPEDKEGMIISFDIYNALDKDQSIILDFSGHVDLSPVWLGERTGMVDHSDELTYNADLAMWQGKDQGNEWYTIFGSNQKPDRYYLGSHNNCAFTPQGKGAVATLQYQLPIKARGKYSLHFYISGSSKSLQEAENTVKDLKANGESFLQKKIDLYQKIALNSQISIPDKNIEKAFEWVKYNTQWLLRTVPDIGTGYAAGMPDYPWWFGVDNEYTLKGAIMTGQKDNVYATIDLLVQLSEKTNGNGRVVHEVSTNGAVFNPGNINETPQFASLIWWVYNWTGDREFLEKYFPFIQKGLDWLMEENDKDQNLLPDGYGMMEIHGLKSEMIDVASYTQKAFSDAAEMADVLGKKELSKQYATTALELKKKINEDFWVEEYNSYADFIGTGHQALEMVDAAIYRADTLKKPWAVDELKALKKRILTTDLNAKKGFVLFHNWVVNTPMEMGIASPEKAIKALDKGSRFVNPFGVFVTGIDRDDSSASDDGSFQGSKMFSYTGAVMTLPTGVQAVSENNYGRPDQALEYLKRMTKSFGFALPGSIYEVSPDYGMMTQAWTLYSYSVPLIAQFFGIQPEAAKKTIHIHPSMPSQWKDAAIKNVVIGDNSINLTYKKTKTGIKLEIEQLKEDWLIVFHHPKPSTTQQMLHGNSVPSTKKDEYASNSAKGKNIVFEIKN